jgi:hypothetical protein
MKKRWLILLLALTPFLTGASFNPGSYPGIYNSGAAQTDGVIWAGPNISVYGACEFFTSAAATTYFMVYNSPTVAGQTVANMIGFCAVSATAPEVCSVYAGGPVGPNTNAGIVGGKGLSWAASSTFPTQTLVTGDSLALCQYMVQ